jgi:hypothetical protein
MVNQRRWGCGCDIFDADGNAEFGKQQAEIAVMSLTVR